MKVRYLRDSDIPRLRVIASHYGFPFPDLDNPLYFGKAVSVEGNNILGAGFLNLCAEATMIIDPDLQKRDKIEVFKDLLITGQLVSQKKIDFSEITKIENWVAFIKDTPQFAEILKNRFGFHPCYGIGLQLDLEK